MARAYDTKGRLFFAETMDKDKGLISMDYADYEGFLVAGIMDEEVDLTLRKDDCVNDYTRQASEYRMKAALYTIKMDGMHPKPQIAITEQDAAQLVMRGFSDGDTVQVYVEALPYRVPREACYDGFKLDIDI